MWAFSMAAIVVLSTWKIFHSLPSQVGCSFQGKLFSIFKLLCLVFVTYYHSFHTSLKNCVLFVISLRSSWENFFGDTRFRLLTKAINLSRLGSCSMWIVREKYSLSQALTFFTQTSVNYWTLLLSLKSYTCTCTVLQSFWAAVNAVKLLNLHALELFVNYMTILTASMGTSIEQYRSRKRRMPYHMFNGDGFLPRLS